MVQRRDVLRWAAFSGLALAVGCRPSPPIDGVEGARPGADVSRPPAVPKDPAPRPSVGLTPEQPPSELEAAPETPPTPEPDPAPDPPESAPGSDELDGTPEQTTEPAHQVEVLCREALGLVPARPDGRSHELTRLTLHHTAVALSLNALAPGRLRGHQRYHMEQGWSDIAYHFAVDLAGNIYQLRDVGTPGDTFTDYEPAGHFLVVCEGNFDQQAPTDAMLAGTAEILAHGASAYGLPPDSLTGHRDHAATTCPGQALHARLGDIRREVARRVSDGTRRGDLCGDAARARVAAVEAG